MKERRVVHGEHERHGTAQRGSRMSPPRNRQPLKCTKSGRARARARAGPGAEGVTDALSARAAARNRCGAAATAVEAPATLREAPAAQPASRARRRAERIREGVVIRRGKPRSTTIRTRMFCCVGSAHVRREDIGLRVEAALLRGRLVAIPLTYMNDDPTGRTSALLRRFASASAARRRHGHHAADLPPRQARIAAIGSPTGRRTSRATTNCCDDAAGDRRRDPGQYLAAAPTSMANDTFKRQRDSLADYGMESCRTRMTSRGRPRAGVADRFEAKEPGAPAGSPGARPHEPVRSSRTKVDDPGARNVDLDEWATRTRRRCAACSMAAPTS